MRRHSTKQPMGPATAPKIAAPATARQKSSSMRVLPGCGPIARAGKDRARRGVGVIMMMGVKGDLLGNPGSEQSDESGIAHHSSGIAFAANVVVQADHVIGGRHHHVKIMADQKNGCAEL